MSEPTNNLDADAFIERWFRTLKEEAVWLKEYQNFFEVQADIEQFIKFYNEERPHSALGYQSPAEFRQNAAVSEQAAA